MHRVGFYETMVDNMLEKNKIYNEDCIIGMKLLDDNSVDSIVTDPPYGLGFMGKQWDTYDKTQFGRKGNEGNNDLKNKKNFNVLPRYRSDNSFYEFSYAWSKEAYRVLKPGGHLLSFGGTRTYHRMACAIEDAGFEIRDMINWVYGSGFPKSLNIGKAIDKMQGNEREDLGMYDPRSNFDNFNRQDRPIGNQQVVNSNTSKLNLTKGTSEFEGWGTALKPAHEPIVVARKPLGEKTVAENVLKYGTGGINIDDCRIDVDLNNEGSNAKRIDKTYNGKSAIWNNANKSTTFDGYSKGRFPSNIIHNGSEEVLKEFAKAGECGAFAPVKSGQKEWGGNIYHKFKTSGDNGKTFYKDGLGTPARFFYCAKASKSERNQGLEGFEEIQTDNSRKEGNPGGDNPRNRGVNKVKNNHPTVKPLKLMEYLVRLVTPKGGIVLDPFIGSGTTGMAAKFQDFNYIGFDITKEYCKIAEARIKSVDRQKRLFDYIIR